jgi:hypothetical protein
MARSKSLAADDGSQPSTVPIRLLSGVVATATDSSIGTTLSQRIELEHAGCSATASMERNPDGRGTSPS